MGDLQGRTAVITGGSSGIGFATAKIFVEAGADVIITGRRQYELDQAIAKIGGTISAIQADSTSQSDLASVFTKIRDEKESIDVLMISAGGGGLMPIGGISEDHYDDIFDRNVKGALFTAQAALPALADGASVILVGSAVSAMGSPAFSVYAASKAALRSFARNWILDLKGRHIRVNTLSPGPIRTPALFGLAGPDVAQQTALVAYMESLVPLGRIGEPEEVAKAALFLASDDSSYVNGSEIFVDGGLAQI